MYSANNPINAIDLDGKNFIIATNPNNAGGFGHTDLFFQDENGNWFKFEMGGENSSSNGESNIFDQIKKVFVEVKGEAKINKINNITDYLMSNYTSDGGEFKEFETTVEEDKRISINANKIKDEINNSEKLYNLWNYNCATSCKDVLNRSNLLGYSFIINNIFIPNSYQRSIMNYNPKTDIQLSPSSSAYGIQ